MHSQVSISQVFLSLNSLPGCLSGLLFWGWKKDRNEGLWSGGVSNYLHFFVVFHTVPVAHRPWVSTNQHFLSFWLHKLPWQPCWIYQDILNYQGKMLFPVIMWSRLHAMWDANKANQKGGERERQQKANICSFPTKSTPAVSFRH